MKAKQVNEALGIGGAKLNITKIGQYDKVWAGEEGILENDGVFIPWNIVDSLMKKYRN